MTLLIKLRWHLEENSTYCCVYVGVPFFILVPIVGETCLFVFLPLMRLFRHLHLLLLHMFHTHHHNAISSAPLALALTITSDDDDDDDDDDDQKAGGENETKAAWRKKLPRAGIYSSFSEQTDTHCWLPFTRKFCGFLVLGRDRGIFYCVCGRNNLMVGIT